MADVRLQKKIGIGRHSSPIKRQRQSEKRQERNKHNRSTMRSAIKKVKMAVENRDKPTAREALKKVIPILSRMAQKGIIHKCTANRYKSNLTVAVDKL